MTDTNPLRDDHLSGLAAMTTKTTPRDLTKLSTRQLRDEAEALQASPCSTKAGLAMRSEADALVPIACGRDSAQRIPGARFVSIPGMGHDLPPPVVEILMQHILPFLAHAESRS